MSDPQMSDVESGALLQTRQEYNEERPMKALEELTPAGYAQRLKGQVH